jgi:hypothetical protein
MGQALGNFLKVSVLKFTPNGGLQNSLMAESDYFEPKEIEYDWRPIDSKPVVKRQSEIVEKLGFAPIDANKLVLGMANGLESKDMSKDVSQCSPQQAKISAAVQKILTDLRKETLEGVEEAIKDTSGVVEA